MASGLATIGSRTGGTPEIIADAGFLFEREDVDGLTEHLARLVTDDTLAAEYGRRGRERAQEFTWDKAWARFKPLLEI